MRRVWELHCAVMADFGFDRLIYGYTRFGKPGALGDFEDAVFLNNHDPEYFNRFIGERMFLKAPILRWARDHIGACSWGEIWRDAESLSEAERRVIAFNRAMNVSAGYSISFPAPSPRSFALISLSARRGLSQDDVDATWANHGREIEAMNNMAHLKILSLPNTTRRGRLTRRQREVLEWVGDGKSNQDIAVILGVSVPTVEKHLRLAREKLGVDTTAQAILKAAFLNQIHIGEYALAR
ncbi:helix-turn-helix transcriptional regulator [Sinisalibacter lacisalsi]|nr:LuxR family transcriptional regulator [Sinisalibacter lacisalsi]